MEKRKVEATPELITAFAQEIQMIDQEEARHEAELMKGAAPGARYIKPAWSTTLRCTGRWRGDWLAAKYLEIVYNDLKRVDGSKELQKYIVWIGQRVEKRGLSIE